MSDTKKCSRCKSDIDPDTEKHQLEIENERSDGYGHKGLCCHCFNLDCGVSLEAVNENRVSEGLPPFDPEA